MNRTILPALAIAALCIAACGKTYNPGPDPSGEPGGNYTMASAMAELMVAPRTVTIDAGTGGTFNGNSGTRYSFPPNAFKTATGVIVTGNVAIQVSEYLKKSDMLFSGMLPISGGEPLLSGGEINVAATQ